MKPKDNISKWLKVFLGLFLIVYALNKFLHFLPTGYGAMPEEAQVFIDAVAFYLPALYVFEIIIGLFLVFNKWTSFILIVLFPLSVTFLIFNLINWDFTDMWPALVVALLNIVLLVKARENYRALFD